jgi:hypothetical protein
MRSGACWALPTPARLTNETESGSWPTLRSCTAMAATITPESAHAANRFPNLETVVGRRMWPTPVHSEARQGLQIRRDGKKGTQESLSTAVVLATPQARDYRTGQASRWENPERTRNLNDQIGGQLNPAWVEWLMGWPVSWTDLESRPAAFLAWQQAFTNESTVCAASETDRFPQRLRSHGEP